VNLPFPAERPDLLSKAKGPGSPGPPPAWVCSAPKIGSSLLLKSGVRSKS